MCVSACLLLSLILPQMANSHPVIANHSASVLYPYGGRIHSNLPESSVAAVENQLLNKWIGTALKFFDFQQCVASNIASSEDECFFLNQLERSSIAVYFASGMTLTPNSVVGLSASGSISSILGNLKSGGKPENSRKRESQKVVAIFPDSSTPKAGGAHDAILALDPYPKKNFAHLVAVFYIDLGVDSRKCKEDHQIYTSGKEYQSYLMIRIPHARNSFRNSLHFYFEISFETLISVRLPHPYSHAYGHLLRVHSNLIFLYLISNHRGSTLM